MMFSLFCSKLLSPSNHRIVTLFSSNTQLAILPFHEILLTIRCFSSLQPQHDKQSFTISYLVNKCGLSPNAARSAVKYVLFDNVEKPDSVLGLLRDLGLTDHTHISQAVRKYPRILVSNVDKTILPKLRFLRSIGFSTHDLQESFCQSRLFCASLKRTIVPCYDILKKSSLLSDEQVVATLIRLGKRNMPNVHNINVNISVLRGIGMPQSMICTFVCRWPIAFCDDVDKFRGAVKEVVERGFDRMQYAFAAAVVVKLQLSSSTWKCKIEAFTRWGLSEDEICLAFRKYPMCMHLSAESIRDKMEFLVNRIGIQPAAVLKSPTILGYSLEKRIAPRCSVIGVLFLKGLIEHKIKLFSILKQTDDQFLANYVMEHEQQVPELLDIVEGKKGVEEVGFEFGEIRGALFR